LRVFLLVISLVVVKQKIENNVDLLPIKTDM